MDWPKVAAWLIRSGLPLNPPARILALAKSKVEWACGQAEAKKQEVAAAARRKEQIRESYRKAVREAPILRKMLQLLNSMAAGGFSPLDVLKMLEPEAEEPIATPTQVIGLDVRGREAVSAPASAAAEPATVVTTAAAAGDEEAVTAAPPGRRRAKHV